MTRKRHQTVFPIETGAQRKAIASPLRQELLAQFAGDSPMAVSDLAHRTGRPASALYYHIKQLAELGFLETAGERRKGKRFETLYKPTADRYELSADSQAAIDDAVSTLRVAQRMSLRDLREALERGDPRTEGPGRNLIALRLQGRIDRATLETVNGHIDAILESLSAACRGTADTTDTEFISFTLALAPLGDRKGNRRT